MVNAKKQTGTMRCLCSITPYYEDVPSKNWVEIERDLWYIWYERKFRCFMCKTKVLLELRR